MNPKELERYSSAITLSDMEVFVFPELMYSLVLANIMSPVIWRWRELDCFKKLENKNGYKKLLRLRQFIMDEFEFNLDLETWGLTRKDKERQRFENFISPVAINASNALFGYEGDKYYFDVDIRKHFGLDKYDSDVIPYWKTETVEAMAAFHLKPGYAVGAGECVSLSTLYAAAAFIICGIPLEDIYMILTPLHSQNFIDIQDGVLTNNRRLITKSMWFNGTEISNKAQRALRNENVTIVAHSSGYIHCLYEDATINRDIYHNFVTKLDSYLNTELNLLIFANFLRCHSDYQEYFQVCRDCHGQAQFLKAELLFHYEHGSHYRVADNTHEKLLAEVSDEDFVSYQLPGRIRCDDLNDYLAKNKPDLKKPQDTRNLTEFFARQIPPAGQLVEQLADFIHVQPKLPAPNKQFIPAEPLHIDVQASREEIIDYLQQMRAVNQTADLAFYAYRDMNSCHWEPFVKAAIDRNPVSREKTASMSQEEVYNWLKNMPNVSIYEGPRLAQPDEVANYQTGDGIEKALLLANVIRQKNPQLDIILTANNHSVTLQAQKEYNFTSEKNLEKSIRIPAENQ